MFPPVSEDNQLCAGSQAQDVGNMMRGLAADRQRGTFLKRLRDIDTGDAHALKILESVLAMQRVDCLLLSGAFLTGT